MAYQSAIAKARHGGGKVKGAGGDGTDKIGRPSAPVEKFPAPHAFVRGTDLGTRADDQLPSRYGENSANVPSSVPVESSHRLSDLDTAPPDGDAVLDALAAGKGSDVSSQTRDVGKQTIPNAHGQVNRSDPASQLKVPAKTGYVESAPVRQPPSGKA